MSKLPVALQMYTVRDAAEKDLFGVLGKVKEMGYDYLEFTADFCGYTPTEIRTQLDRLDLKVISAHVPIEWLISDCGKAIQDFGALGCEYIVVPWLDDQRRPGKPGWPVVVEEIKRIGRTCREAGITLLYHNHDFEFVKIGGEYALDLLYSAISADCLQSELDTCWIKFAGVDPVEYILKYSGRCPVVHLKDFVMPGMTVAHGKDDSAVGNEVKNFDFRPVGYGVQDFPAILDASGKAGAKYLVVEQDSSSQRPSMEAARLSREYLKTLGF